MRLVAITLSSMVLMSLVLMSFVTKSKIMLLQCRSWAAEKLSSLMRLIILTLIQLNLLYGEPLKNLHRIARLYLHAISKTVLLIQSTLDALLLISKSTVLNQNWRHNSLKELKVSCNQRILNIQKMLSQPSSRNTFLTIEEFLTNFSDILCQVRLIAAFFLMLLIYNLIILLSL